MIVCGFIALMHDPGSYMRLIAGYAGVVPGQTFFLVGLDISILPIGKLVGKSLVKMKKYTFMGITIDSKKRILCFLDQETENKVMAVIKEKVRIHAPVHGI